MGKRGKTNQVLGNKMVNFFEIACAEAERGMLNGDGGPFGAIVVKEGKVIGRGHNQVLLSHDSTAHAEIIAIRQAEQALRTHDLTDCEIYTTCYPCPMCMGAIMWARISKLHYGCTTDEAAAIGFDDRTFYEAISNPSTNRFIVMEHYDNPTCHSLFEKWLKTDGRKLY
jgi:guanine deaminase